MPAAIDPTQIPGANIEPAVIDEQARTIGTLAASVRDNGSDVHFKWQGLAAVYSAPESGTLLGLMQPVSSQATQAGDNLEVVSSALTQFASDVRPIQAALDSLRTQAQWFVDHTVRNGVYAQVLNPAWISTQGYYGASSSAASSSYSSPSTGGAGTTTADIPKYRTEHREWHEDQDAVDRNNELISQVNAQMVLMWEAERTCANKIRALYGAPALHSFQSEDDALGYGLDEIPEGTEMPWGAEVERSEGCGEATLNFVFKDFLWEGIIVGGIWGTVEGLGTLVLGYNPATGEWFSGDAYGAAWGNLGLLVADVAINSSPLAVVFAADDVAQAMGGGFLPDEVRGFKDKADEALLNTGKALVAWDKWQDDPGTALGETVFNVGTILLPAGAAVVGVKTAGTAANIITKMARVADFIDPGAWALSGAMKMGGLTLKGIDGLVGKLDFGGHLADDLSLSQIDVYKGVDATSALNSMVDDLKIPIDEITVRIDDGIPVLEAPGVRIELPAGSFDATALHGGVDAGAHLPTPEPVHVGAGHADAALSGGSRVTDSVVHDAPTTTHSTTSEPATTGADAPSHSTTSGGDSGNGGSGDASPGSASASPADDGWTPGPAQRGNPIDPHYAEPLSEHGQLADAYAPPAEIPADVRPLVSDPDALYGRGADGHAYSRGEWEERYMGADDRPIYPGNDGAVPGTRVSYDDMDAFRRDHGDTIDRLGGSGGAYLSPEGVLFEQRALPGSNLNSGYHVFHLADELPPGVHIEVSEVAPAFGQPGGGIQLQFVHVEDGVLSVEQLLSSDYGILESSMPTAPGGLDAGAVALSDLQSPVPGSVDVSAIHYDSLPPDMQRALIRHEYPGLLGVNATRFDGVVSGTMDPALSKLGWTQNCTRCVIAVDQLMDGMHTSAMPSAVPRDIGDVIKALGVKDGFHWMTGYEDIVQRMTGMPEGSRGVVYIARPDGSAHVFNVLHDRNGIVFLDGQTGAFAQLENVQQIGLMVTKNG